jgi:hypothetical protein
MVFRWIAYPITILLIFAGTAKAEAQKPLLDLPISRLHEILPWEWKKIKAVALPAAA